MSSPEIVQEIVDSETSPAIDYIEIATLALAKLKAAGHSGVIYEHPPEAGIAKVVELENYRPANQRVGIVPVIAELEPVPEIHQAAIAEPVRTIEELFDDPEAVDEIDLRVEASHPARVYDADFRLELTRGESDKAQREAVDLRLVLAAQKGDTASRDQLIKRYQGFVRLKASSYFIAGGDSQDTIQEGMIGLYKALRDFNPNKEASFRSFAELCVTRQIITAVKTATRFKHAPMNTYVSFSHTPKGQSGDGDITLGDALPGPAVNDPAIRVISTQELQALVHTLSTTLSSLEADALRLFLEGLSYEQMAEELYCDEKTIDNALQRVKRKILTHQKAREVSL